jgi:hypothetical protein
MITQEVLKAHLLYDPLTGIFTRKISLCNRVSIGDTAGNKNMQGYIAIRILGKLYKAHRLAWLYSYGEIPDDIDHINGIKFDNRISNLRNCTRKQNSENQKLRSTNGSGHRGVYWVPLEGKFKAQVGHNGLKYHLGTFADINDAIHAVREFRDSNYTHDKTEYSA